MDNHNELTDSLQKVLQTELYCGCIIKHITKDQYQWGKHKGTLPEVKAYIDDVFKTTSFRPGK